MIDYKEFKKEVDKLRVSGAVKNYSEFAAKIGKKPGYVSDILNGKRQISEKLLLEVSEIFPTFGASSEPLAMISGKSSDQIAEEIIAGEISPFDGREQLLSQLLDENKELREQIRRMLDIIEKLSVR